MKAVHGESEEKATEKNVGVKKVIEAISTVEMKAVHGESEEKATGEDKKLKKVIEAISTVENQAVHGESEEEATENQAVHGVSGEKATGKDEEVKKVIEAISTVENQVVHKESEVESAENDGEMVKGPGDKSNRIISDVMNTEAETSIRAGQRSKFNCNWCNRLFKTVNGQQKHENFKCKVRISYHAQSAEKYMHKDEGYNEVAAEADREKVGSKRGRSGHGNVVNVGNNGGVRILYKNEMTMSEEEANELEAKLLEEAITRWGQTNEEVEARARVPNGRVVAQVPEVFSQRGGSGQMDEGSSNGKVEIENNVNVVTMMPEDFSRKRGGDKIDGGSSKKKVRFENGKKLVTLMPEDFSQREGSDQIDEGSSKGKVGVVNIKKSNRKKHTANE